MSLWEVSEALKTAVAPPAEAMLADAGASPESSADVIGMGLLDALVALEETEQLAGRRAPPSASPPATGTPSETECAEGDAPILDPDELLAMLHPDAQIGGNAIRDWVRWDSGLGPDAYAARMHTPGVWGGAIEIAVFAMIYATPVEVYTQHGPAGTYRRISAFNAAADAEPVRVHYGGGVHYDALEAVA